MQIAVVIPVKSFSLAKGRLADTLNEFERADLARTCAETVVRAALPLPTFVVCSDSDVATWATHLGATAVDCQTPGLDTAVAAGRRVAEDSGAEHIIVAHADLPLARRLDHVVREGIITFVPDRHRDGTNVMAFPSHTPFSTAYGPGSFDNHIRIANDAELRYEVILDETLELDLDTADDLSELALREKDTE